MTYETYTCTYISRGTNFDKCGALSCSFQLNPPLLLVHTCTFALVHWILCCVFITCTSTCMPLLFWFMTACQCSLSLKLMYLAWLCDQFLLSSIQYRIHMIYTISHYSWQTDLVFPSHSHQFVSDGRLCVLRCFRRLPLFLTKTFDLYGIRVFARLSTGGVAPPFAWFAPLFQL